LPNLRKLRIAYAADAAVQTLGQRFVASLTAAAEAFATQQRFILAIEARRLVDELLPETAKASNRRAIAAHQAARSDKRVASCFFCDHEIGARDSAYPIHLRAPLGNETLTVWVPRGTACKSFHSVAPLGLFGMPAAAILALQLWLDLPGIVLLGLAGLTIYGLVSNWAGYKKTYAAVLTALSGRRPEEAASTYPEVADLQRRLWVTEATPETR
jgi:hypothetical protein